MEVYNVEISDKYIFYTKDKAEDAAIARMPKEAVLLIKRQDGSTVNLYETAVPVQSTPAEAQAPVILTPELLDEAARRTNADRIAQANLPVSFFRARRGERLGERSKFSMVQDGCAGGFST